MRKIIRFDQAGLTLVELVIGISLASVVMSAIAIFIVGNIRFSNTAQDEIIIQEQVRRAMQVIVDLSMDKESYVASSNQLVLKKGTKQVTFKLEGNDLKFTNESNQSETLAKNIESFKVTDKGSKFFNVTIKGIKNKGNKKKEVSFELTNEVFLRN
ncbi:MAG TPA: hypothetical protein GX687_04005 [Clostridia bacterium]|nr:hypothetical protein [Clostridia bacterium]